ncbi:MAG: hypothetical protein GF344_00240 [Chitinivibrionales bacterium]|nr:hypothetical protein [Chitinivibrionales bacterium]MBD3355560.1 hypothetical protein [Chitinivibrionales bacterium]
MTLVLSGRERTLLRKYGGCGICPTLERELAETKGLRGDYEITASAGEWEQAVGEMSYYVNHRLRSMRTMEEVDGLCEYIESRLRRG